MDVWNWERSLDWKPRVERLDQKPNLGESLSRIGVLNYTRNAILTVVLIK